LSNSESSDEHKKSENGAKEAKRYDELLGADNCSVFGEDVIFVANDWHAGVMLREDIANPVCPALNLWVLFLGDKTRKKDPQYQARMSF
jgi:hypothetical protein